MKSLILRGIRFYQAHISPHKRQSCRFVPSCSSYALAAVEQYGACYGSFLAIKRIMRCHPLSKGGYDPVPPLPDATIRRDENP